MKPDIASALPPARWTLAGLSLAMLLPSLGTSIANVGLPTLERAYAAPFADVQWIVLAYLLATTTLIVSAGRLGDLMGRRLLLLIGIGVFTLASAACGAATSLWLVVAARAVQGLGAAIMLALTIAFVSETVPKAQTARAMGLLGSMSAIGTALGPSLGGVLIAAFDWRAIFLINVPLGIVAFALASRTLPIDRHVSAIARPGFDTAGTLVLALALACYALAMTIGHGRFGVTNAALLVAALAGAALFARVESHAASPLIQLGMFREGTFGASLVMSAIVATVMMTTLVIGPFYLSRTLHLTTQFVGLVMSVGPLVAALSGVPAGRLADRFGAQRIAIAGLSAIAIGACVLAIVPASFGIPGFVAPIVVITLGYALFQAANTTIVMTDRAASQRGVISGMLNLSRNLGLITGASVFGAIFAADGLPVTFGVVAALVLGAVGLARASHMSSLSGAMHGNR